MIMVTVLMVALKGAVRDFYNLLTTPQTVSNSYAQTARAQATSNTSSTYHMQRVVCHVVRRDSLVQFPWSEA